MLPDKGKMPDCVLDVVYACRLYTSDVREQTIGPSRYIRVPPVAHEKVVCATDS
ncbi:hypothetical protein CHS0354_011125, partial [Potamilus streckersoni]